MMSNVVVSMTSSFRSLNYKLSRPGHLHQKTRQKRGEAPFREDEIGACTGGKKPPSLVPRVDKSRNRSRSTRRHLCGRQTLLGLLRGAAPLWQMGLTGRKVGTLAFRQRTARGCQRSDLESPLGGRGYAGH